jgi:XRE family transcriptional regulator, regulator of sulfur utilization
MEQLTDALANNLKKIREERGLSLDKLSEMTGVSKSMLRQIEIGQSNPTITTIWKIANGLRLPFTALIQEERAEVTLQSFKEHNPLPAVEDGYRIYPLMPFSPERSFESYYLEMEPGTVLSAEPHQANAEEQIFLMQGQLKITVQGADYLVAKGNFIDFQANCDHRYENAAGDELVIAIMLISYLP